MIFFIFVVIDLPGVVVYLPVWCGCQFKGMGPRVFEQDSGGKNCE
jgi:hypothetical protein